MIFRETFLFHDKIEIFTNVLNYFDYKIFIVIFYRHSALDASVNIAKIKLSNLRIAKKRITKVRTMLRLEKDLVGRFAVEDTFTKSKKSVTFDAGTAFRALNSQGVIINKL